MDRQYEHFSSGVSHHHGFLSYSSSEYTDSVAKKRIENDFRYTCLPQAGIVDLGFQKSKPKIQNLESICLGS
jgi:hypothetical protein